MPNSIGGKPVWEHADGPKGNLGSQDTIETLRAQLNVVNVRVAELEAEIKLRDGVIENIDDEYERKLAAQALTIKTMRSVLEKFIDSHEECTDFDGFTAQIVSMDDYHEAQEALAIPDNSTEILQDWLNKKCGEPVVKFNWNTGAFVWLTPYSHREHHNQPLYRKPEIK